MWRDKVEYFTEILLVLGFIFVIGLLVADETKPKTEVKKDYK